MMKKLLYHFKKIILWIGLFVILGISFLLIKLVKFKKLMNFVSNVKEDVSPIFSEKSLNYILQFRSEIEKVSKYTPFRSKCFEQALTAHFFLRLLSTSHTIYFGVGKNEKGELLAHAWCKTGDIILTGYRTMNSFTAVNQFSYTSSTPRP